MRRVDLVVGALVAAAVLAWPAWAFDDVFSRTLPLKAGGGFSLENINGPVVLSGWDREEVEVRAVKSAASAGDLDRVRIIAEERDGGVSVSTVYPRDGDVEVTVSYDVRVPKRVLLKRVATVNGTVRVNGLHATGELFSVNGNLEVTECTGGLLARTTNGDIRMELAHVIGPERLAMATVNGSIELTLPANAGVLLDVHSLRGDFQSELPVQVEGPQGRREFQARIGGGGVPIELRTVNGAIRVLVRTQKI